MKQLWVLPWFLLMALGMGRAWAADPVELEIVTVETPVLETVVSNPPAAVEKVKWVVNLLSPGYDTLYNIRDGSWTEGISASLWNFRSKDYLLASLRLGYASEADIYSTLRLDLPGISHRFIPQTVRGIATTGYLDLLWNAVGKYGTVGPFCGYGFEENAVSYGVALGGQVSF